MWSGPRSFSPGRFNVPRPMVGSFLWHTLSSAVSLLQSSCVMKPFENPSNLVKDPRGMTYGKAAVLAGGTLAIAYYIARRRDTRTLATQSRDVGTTQQVATDRHGQQHRPAPPSKKTPQDERA